MTTPTKSNLAALADAYASAKADLADLEDRVAELRREILATDYGSILGAKCKVTVEHRTVRRLSVDLVAALLSPTDFEKCFKPSMSAIVRVKAR